MRARRATPALVSLIMPVWQPHRPWLTAAVESALAQSHCSIELVIVDDGCEPAVEDLVDTANDGRVRVVRIAHSGQSAALNAGIAAARGEWLRFVDADDVLPQGSTRHLAGLMDGQRIVAYGSTLVCDEHLRPRSTIGSTLQGDVLTDCLLGRFHTRHPSMLFPRRVVDAAGPWDTGFHVSADWDFVLRTLEHAHVRGDQEVATLYRRHSRSVSRTANVSAGEESRRRMIARYFDRHEQQRGSRLQRRAWAALNLDRGRAYWDVRQYGASVDRLARAVCNEPLAGVTEVARFVGHRLRRKLARTVFARAQPV